MVRLSFGGAAGDGQCAWWFLAPAGHGHVRNLAVPHAPVAEVFIHRYGRASIFLPVGRHRLVLARGKVWHGAPEYFGGSGVIQVTLPPITLTDDNGEIIGKNIFLQRHLYGNLPTRDVSHP